MSHEHNERTLSMKYESLDYDLVENVIYLEHQHRTRFKNYISREFQRWAAILLIGLVTAGSGFLAFVVVESLTRVKYNFLLSLSDSSPCNQNTTSTLHSLSGPDMFLRMLKPYFFSFGWNSIFVLFGAFIVTYIAPIAAGSGIPVVKCYLNGLKIPHVVRAKTYLVKLLGVISSVVGGLAVGKEGPFIHCGAAVGAGVSQGKASTFNFDLGIFKSFRNDRDKRDFVSAGASAGVAAAFGAPIGGVLFALEEGASFWNQSLTWRLFFCSMTTSFSINLMMVAYNQQGGILAFHSLVNFGLVEELDYFWFEIPIYICIAICGGLIGASFCYFHVLITKFRKIYVAENRRKVIEAVFISCVTVNAGMLLMLYAPDCRPLPPNTESSLDQTHPTAHSGGYLTHYSNNILISQRNSINRNETIPPYDGSKEVHKFIDGHILTFVCPPGQYSAMSSLWLKTSENAASTFMVLQENIWSIKTLAIFFVVYYCLAVVTYGLSVSAGVFVPSLLIGASGGRLIGALLLYYFGPQEWLLQQNKFAIIGAAAVLGGVVRMTISLTVIIIEATGCISFGMPIMICLMVSKWVADSFIIGLYDIAIEMANVPFLEWEPPLRSHTIYASDIMEPKVKVLQTTETVANLIDILKSTTHNGFPVVDLNYIEPYYENHSRNKQAQQLAGDSSNNIEPAYSDLHNRPPTSRSKLQDHLSSSSNETVSDDKTLITGNSAEAKREDFSSGSFQRCSISARRKSHGRFRGLVLRWQLLVILDLKIFNENERSYEMLNLDAFQKQYPRYPTLENVIANLDEETYKYHVDLRSVMNPNPYIVHYSSSFPRIFQIFRSLGLRHLVVIDDRNEVVGMITRKDLARYVRERDKNGLFRFYELKYSS